MSDYHDKLKAKREALLAARGQRRQGATPSASPKSIEDAIADLNQADARELISLIAWIRARAISDADFGQWRGSFTDALRNILMQGDAEVASAAAETLINHEDEETQQLLIDGLGKDGPPNVPAAIALRLLSQNPHAAARNAALTYVDSTHPESERLEALRVLASDNKSVQLFANLLADETESEAIRSLAATALLRLDPIALQNYSDVTSGRREHRESESNLNRHVQALLRAKQD